MNYDQDAILWLHLWTWLEGNIAWQWHVLFDNNTNADYNYLFTHELSMDMRHETLSMSKCSTASRKAVIREEDQIETWSY